MADREEGQLEHTNVSIARWEQERDKDAIKHLDQILSPDLVFRRANKSVAGKHEFMEGLAEPSPFVKRESKDATVEIHGDRALVTLMVVTTKQDGAENRYRNIRMFIRHEGTWQLEFWFNDDVTQVTGL